MENEVFANLKLRSKSKDASLVPVSLPIPLGFQQSKVPNWRSGGLEGHPRSFPFLARQERPVHDA